MKLKVKKNEFIYIVALSIFLLVKIIDHTNMAMPNEIKYGCIMISCILVGIKVIFFDKNTIKNIIIYIAILIASLAVIYKSSQYEILYTTIFIIGAKDVDFIKIISSYVKVSSFVILIMMICFAFGIIKETYVVRDGVIRHTFGYVYPTDFVALLFYVFLADLYYGIVKKKNIFGRDIAYFIIGLLTFHFSDSRLGSASILLLIPMSWIMKYSDKFDNKKIFNLIKKYSIIIAAGLSIFLTNFYMKYPNNNLLIWIDKELSYRLTFNIQAIKSFGYSLWGQDIYSQYYMYNDKWFFIDNSYYIMFIEYGLIISIIIIITYSLFLRKEVKLRKSYIPWVWILISINSIVGQQFFMLEYNIFLLALLADNSELMLVGNDNKKMMENLQ